MPLESKIEAVLFWKGEPVAVKELAKILEVEKSEIEAAILKLKTTLTETSRGLTLVQNGQAGQGNDEVMLYTSPETSDLIKKITKDDLTRDISKAGVEVLSMIMYRGPISKRDIDYVRGVNSSFIVRNLLVRGLIERIDSKDNRSFMYQPTFELLAHLGVSRKEDLPDFELVQKDIESFMTRDANDSQEKPTEPSEPQSQI